MDVNLDAPVAQAQANKVELGNLFAGQRGETSDFLNRYSGAINSQPTTSAMAARIGEELNLPTLQKNAMELQNTIYDLPGTYSAATRGFDVNANQLARIIGTKQAQLAPSAERAQSYANAAQQQLNTRLGYEQTDQAKQLLPYQSEQGLLSDRLARETSGYTQAMGQELDAIISKMNAGVTLSEGEKNRAHDLAMAESNFERQKQLNEQQAKLANTGSNQNRYISIGDGAVLYDTQTGQKIENPKNFAGSGGGDWA